MPKKEEEPNPVQTQDLVIFKEKDEAQEEVIEKYSFETVDQEDKIKLFSDYRPFAGHFQYSILIDNQSLAPITEMKIKVKYPEFLTLSRLFPPSITIPQIKTENGINQLTLEFDELNEKSNKQFHLHFTPNSLDHMGEIRTIVTYVNNKDTVRVLDSKPAEITLYKIAIEPKVVPSSFIRDFAQTSGIKKAIKSMGVGTGFQNIDSEVYFNFLEQLFAIHNFQMVTKDVAKRILWYFGTESVNKDDILAIGQITSNKIEIIASSLNHYTLISFLTQFAKDFKQFVKMNDIVSSEDKIYDLECSKCGAILPYFPQKNQLVVCENCSHQTIIW
jgi:hypothetical protein